MEKIDIHKSDKNYQKCLVLLRKQIPKTNAQLIERYLEDSSIGKTQKQRIQAGIRVRIRNLYLLKTCAKFFKKPINNLTEKDIETFVRALNDNTITKTNGKPYSEQVKSNMKVVLISFLRWAVTDSAKFHKLTSWISTSFKKKEVIELSEEEIKKMLDRCVTLKQKLLVALLFDTGARIEEFLNIRIGDVIEVRGDVPYYKIVLREEFSKTTGRTISLLWKYTTPLLREWLLQHPNKDDLEAQLYPSTYDGVRMLLKKIGLRALKRSVNPHLMRHSSATFYAGRRFDYFQLCKRYGWQIGSDVPNRYIHKSGINEKEAVEKVKAENIEDLQNALELFKENDKTKSEIIEDLRSKIELIYGKIDEVNKRLEK